jgi:hypothetical protein
LKLKLRRSPPRRRDFFRLFATFSLLQEIRIKEATPPLLMIVFKVLIFIDFVNFNDY